jgi:hypothetical protein
MWRFLFVTAVLALVLAATVPGMADSSISDSNVNLEFGNEIDETGSVTGNTNVSGSGDSGNQCAAPEQFGNTGNPQSHLDVVQDASKLDDLNAEGVGSAGVLQYASEMDDLKVEGGSPMTFEPASSSTCTQQAQQAAAAGGNSSSPSSSANSPKKGHRAQ